MQRILCNVESWCSDRDLSVNPSETEMILFTRKYKPEKLSPITFYGKELIFSTQVKYLGVILDPKLNWQLHLDAKCNKAIVSFYQLMGSIGKTWGITPKITRWMYTAVIRPSLSYASLVWWPRVENRRKKAGTCTTSCLLTYYRCYTHHTDKGIRDYSWFRTTNNLYKTRSNACLLSYEGQFSVGLDSLWAHTN